MIIGHLAADYVNNQLCTLSWTTLEMDWNGQFPKLQELSYMSISETNPFRLMLSVASDSSGYVVYIETSFMSVVFIVWQQHMFL